MDGLRTDLQHYILSRKLAIDTTRMRCNWNQALVNI